MMGVPLYCRMLLYPVPTFKALKLLLAMVVTLGRLMALRVLALALLLVVPVGVMDRPLTVVEVALLLALVKVSCPRLAPLALRAVSATERMEPEVVALVTDTVPLVWV